MTTIENAAAQPVSSDLASAYFKEVRKHPILTRAEEVELGKKKDWYVLGEPGVSLERQLEGKRAFDRMLQSNLRLVVCIARRYNRTTTLPLSDLCQEGTLGLHRAIEKFDWRLGYKLSTYATLWIRQAIRRAIREQERLIRIPPQRMAQLMSYRRAVSEFETRCGRAPTTMELCGDLGLSREDVRDLQVLAQDTLSLNARIGEDLTELGDLVPDCNAVRAEIEVERAEPGHILERALAELSVKERCVIRLRHGIGDDSARTLDEVAVKLGVTRERVRRYEQTAWARLRRNDELAAFADSTVS